MKSIKMRYNVIKVLESPETECKSPLAHLKLSETKVRESQNRKHSERHLMIAQIKNRLDSIILSKRIPYANHKKVDSEAKKLQ